jgi:pimeloyl-ACP methyl ester carboxylesterase
MKRSLQRWPLWVVVAVLAGVLAACSAPRNPANADVSIDGLTTQSLFGSRTYVDIQCPDATTVHTREIRGSTLDGSQYLIYVPDGWRTGSRDLVLYAHGFIDPSQPVGFPSPLPSDVIATRDGLVCRGFAVAASSYSANGYAVAEGVRDTHLLNPIFWLRVGFPRHTYLFGVSLGGLITTQLAETFPWRYDGALPMCGPVGGSLLEFDYIGNIRMFFDMLYGAYGVLDGSVTDPAPPPTDDWRAAVTAVVQAHPEGLAALASLFVALPDPTQPGNVVHVPLLQVQRDDNGMPTHLQTEGLTSLLAALRYHVEGGLDAVQRVRGSNPFDNHALVYEQLTPTGLQQIDTFAGQPIPRFTAGLRATIYYTLHYQPTGKLSVPMLTLHNLVDPDVPYLHELVYQALAGPSGYLLSVPVPIPVPLPGITPDDGPYGHCAVDPANVALAFGYLVTHVEADGGGPWPAMTATLQQLKAAPGLR